MTTRTGTYITVAFVALLLLLQFTVLKEVILTSQCDAIPGSETDEPELRYAASRRRDL